MGTTVKQLKIMIKRLERFSFLVAQVEPDKINVYDKIIGVLINALDEIQEIINEEKQQ